MKKLTRALLVFLMMACPAVGWSQHEYPKEIPDLPAVPALVTDFAHLLTPEEKEQLEEKLNRFEQSSSNEVSVVTVKSLGSLDVSTFAMELGRKWNIGKAERKNGVLLLLALDEHKVNISPGYGLSGVLPDITCNHIIQLMLPAFKRQAYYEGINAGCEAIIAATKGEFQAEAPSKKHKSFHIFSLLKFIFFFVILIFYFLFRNRGGGGMYINRRGPAYMGGGLWGGFGGGSNWGGGGGDSGGFGGFGGGGGGFDGGGASGSW